MLASEEAIMCCAYWREAIALQYRKMAEGGGEVIEMGGKDLGGGDTDQGEIAETGFGGGVLSATDMLVAPHDDDWITRTKNALKADSEQAANVKKQYVERYLLFLKRIANDYPDYFTYVAPEIEINTDRFDIDPDGGLSLEHRQPRTGKIIRVRISDPQNPAYWRSLKEVKGEIGKKGINGLGLFYNNQDDLLGRDAVRALSLRKVGNASNEIVKDDDIKADDLDSLTDSLAEPSIKEAYTQTSAPYFRELETYDKQMQSIAGELRVQENKRQVALGKVAEIEKTVKSLVEQGKTGVDDKDPEIAEQKRLLTETLDEIKAIEESIAIQQRKARSQASAIRELVGRILREDTSLGEKLRTIFREQGFTVAAVITALGAIIAALVEGLTGGGGSSSSSSGSGGDSDKKSPRSAAKRAFDAMASGLRWLASKAAAALPGIIGAVVSFLLKGAAAVASWLGANLWAVLVVVGGVGYGVVRQALRDKRGETLRKKNH